MTESKIEEKILTEIEYEGKTYTYSWLSILIFAVMSPTIFIVAMELIDLGWEWIHPPSIIQTTWVINLFTNMELTYDLVYIGGVPDHYLFIVPGQLNIGFETYCTGLQATVIFAAIIFLTPHSKDPVANEHIWRRKIISFVIAAFLFHIVNILRMVIQITLYWQGADWNTIHIPIGAASSFIAAVIILLMHRWLPEFILSIMWISGEIRGVVVNFKQKNSQNEKTDESPVPAIKDVDKK